MERVTLVEANRIIAQALEEGWTVHVGREPLNISRN